jgi:hypothetical protein
MAQPILKQEGCHLGDYLPIMFDFGGGWNVLKLNGILSATEGG